MNICRRGHNSVSVSTLQHTLPYEHQVGEDITVSEYPSSPPSLWTPCRWGHNCQWVPFTTPFLMNIVGESSTLYLWVPFTTPLPYEQPVGKDATLSVSTLHHPLPYEQPVGEDATLSGNTLHHTLPYEQPVGEDTTLCQWVPFTTPFLMNSV